ncbi:MAG: YkgJ family cysteine cluster protein [Planctomycetaceae bacterium]|nr:YkgJ family cysteine cluster protein [Planctomycetaceae bacterium]
MMSVLPWFQDGLRFTCKQCGRCCTGEPGYVWVDDNEITAMAKQCGLDRETFVSSFVRKAGKKKSLVELPNGDCIFFDREIKGCKLYDSRPIQCRTWPFWDQNIDRLNSWKKTAKFCPGCQQGELHPVDEIIEKRNATGF